MVKSQFNPSFNVDEAPSRTYPGTPFTFIKNTQVTAVFQLQRWWISSDWTIDYWFTTIRSVASNFLTGGEISGTPDTGDS